MSQDCGQLAWKHLNRSAYNFLWAWDNNYVKIAKILIVTPQDMSLKIVDFFFLCVHLQTLKYSFFCGSWHFSAFVSIFPRYFAFVLVLICMLCIKALSILTKELVYIRVTFGYQEIVSKDQTFGVLNSLPEILTDYFRFFHNVTQGSSLKESSRHLV